MNRIFSTRGEMGTDRVRLVTDPEINERIDHETEQNVRYYGVQSRESISQRIRELDDEWDVEKCFATCGAALGLAGLVLSVFGGGRKWLALPGTVLSFLLLQGRRGYCPGTNAIRRMGVRTRREIDAEKFALKFMRGDFDDLKDAYEATIKAVEAYKACMK